MVAMRRERSAKSQIGYQTDSASTYQQAGGDINFANGLLSYIRIPTSFIKGSTINSATLTFNMIVKNGDTAQSCTNRIRAHASGDSPMLRLGVNEWTNTVRAETAAYVDWVPYWPAGATEVNLTVNVQNIVQELVNRGDFQSGGYITFIIWTMDETGSDMGFRANNDFAPTVTLVSDFTPPTTDVNYTINRCENSEFSTEVMDIESPNTNPAPYWGQGNSYGAFVDPANFGTIARDTSFTRLPGITSMRFTCGTPPAETHKRTGPFAPINNWRSDEPFTFSGWIYISNSVPTSSSLWIGDPYHGQSGTTVVERGQWVPFCSQPLVFPGDTSYATRWPAIGLDNFQAGWQFWVSEPCFTNLGFRHMPFNGLTPDAKTSSGVTLIDHKSTVSKQQSIREWVPRTAVVRNGVVKRVPHYIKRADGILQLVQPINGRATIDQLPAIPIQDLPAGKTISEL